MRVDEVRVGMRVRFREWDDMMAEAHALSRLDGTDRVFPSSVFCGDRGSGEEYCFTYGMREFCGKEFVIEGINRTRLRGFPTIYVIEPWMVFPVFDDGDVIFDGSIDELFDLLRNEE